MVSHHCGQLSPCRAFVTIASLQTSDGVQMDRYLTPVNVLSLTAGLVIVLATLTSLVRSMLMPLPRVTLAARGSRGLTENVGWLIAGRLKSFSRQDAVLSGVGPVSVLVELVLLMGLFLVGFALMIYGSSSLDFSDSLVEAGSTLLTLGLLERENAAQLSLNFLAAFIGVTIIAILIGYLFILYSAYNQREQLVVRTSIRTGEPAWGPELLCRQHVSREAPLYSTADLIAWVSSLRSQHTMYPVLNQFRSYTPMRSWLVTLIAVLDAAALSISVTSTSDKDAHSLIIEGSQTCAELFRNLTMRGRWFSREPLPVAPIPEPPLTPAQSAVFRAVVADRELSAKANRTSGPVKKAVVTLSRDEFDTAWDLMSEVGLDLRSDKDQAWQDFKRLRACYEETAVGLAYRLHVVPAPWTGKRRFGITTIWPNLVVDHLASESREAKEPQRDE